MKGCFLFQWGGGGFIFKWAECAPWGSIGFDRGRGGSKKMVEWGGGGVGGCPPMLPPLWETVGEGGHTREVVYRRAWGQTFCMQ